MDKSFLKNITHLPGVYKMLNSKGEVIYIGKARNLKRRVNSYFLNNTKSIKTKSLVEKISNIEIIVTNSESEALLLECNLIKKEHPKYNILLRDDKSYPFIYISVQHDYPALLFYRGKKMRNKGRYFGPYPNVGAAQDTLSVLEKIFKLRTCKDSFFNNRSRPCLKYQIKRCHGPCVKFITKQKYQELTADLILFLEGKSQKLIADLENRMELASKNMDYEAATIYRDQIKSLRKTQESQYITSLRGDLDVIFVSQKNNITCIQLLKIRLGDVIASESFFPKIKMEQSRVEILQSFIAQFYLSNQSVQVIPEQIIVSEDLTKDRLLGEVLTEVRTKKCNLIFPHRGKKLKYLMLAKRNADISLDLHLSSKANIQQRFIELSKLVGLQEIKRLECFDISHISGSATVGSCVVFNNLGPLKKDYRTFNIKNITPGDDCAAMYQALIRRYTKLKNNNDKLPDILFIDGGLGQVNQAIKVFKELEIKQVMIIGVAKGLKRKAGLETLILSNGDLKINLDPASPALHLIQHIRDEAHRTAITSHRRKRDKKLTHSQLEEISGIGAKKRQALYRRFGGLSEIKKASLEELIKVPGINKVLAESIYDFLHE